MPKERSQKRCLWQVAEIFGWPKEDLNRVKKFYLQPEILLPFTDFFFNWRLKDGLKHGAQGPSIVNLALEVLQDDPNKWLSEIESEANPPIGDCDAYLTIIVVRTCRLPGGPWAGKGDGELEAMVKDAMQIVKVLNIQFELLPKKGVVGTALPQAMFWEAKKLGHDLNLGVDVPEHGFRRGKRPARQAKVPNNAQADDIKAEINDDINANNDNDNQSQVTEDVAPITFERVLEEFKLYYPYIESIEHFQFTIVSVYHVMGLPENATAISPLFLDKYVFLRPTWLQVREGLLGGLSSQPYSYMNWLDAQGFETSDTCLTWDVIESLIGTKEGQLLSRWYYEMGLRGDLQF